MKKMKLFPKTFSYTMLLMCIIIIIAHLLLYLFMPSVYVKQKNKNLTSLSEDAVEVMSGKTIDDAIEEAKKLSENTEASITMTASGSTYVITSYMTLNNAISKGVSGSPTPILQEYETKVDMGDVSANLDVDESERVDELNSVSFASLSSSVISREKKITLSNGNKATLSFVMNLQPVEEASEVMFLILPYTITISILLSLCGAYVYARALTKPIKAICASTKEMETLDEQTKCMVSSQDEIGELAQGINQLYSSLQKTIQSLEDEIQLVSKSEKMKVDFLRSASHELKTPLTSMSVILENMILEVGKYKDHKTYIIKCKAIVDHLSLMVKDILDTSAMEIFTNPNAVEEINLETLIQQVSEPFCLIAKAKKIEMTVQLDWNGNINVNCNMFKKVLSNLLSNAVQYTQENQHILISLQEQTLKIYNECTPIEEQHLEHIMEAFYRPDFSRSKESGGNGLGLYIVDQLLNAMYLPYSFEPYEKGMCFTIALSKA